ncbi:hypothetical protein OG936_39025 (plasmid) [Streptomyces sp. NBC_00846]|uniref:hypothetical protein n=1 Tax=Streptomyces sp. NBC_00846 TaxID=2975849 RepID=UPI002F908F6D|nr:hypothetical protein OG936_39025 [Streptomyces sp. NBC_00846]
MAISTGSPPRTLRGGIDYLNGRHHQLGLRLFLFIVVAHWAEHLVQAYQIYVMGWPIPEARGVLGVPFPWLVTSEWMHYGYALVMMVGLFLLRPGFTGRSGTWWKVSLGIQVWHHLEHLLLLVQVLVGAHLLGKAVPTSLIQLIAPRVELHLFYNTLVTVPMVVAMYLHTRANRPDNAAARCACAPKD